MKNESLVDVATHKICGDLHGIHGKSIYQKLGHTEAAINGKHLTGDPGGIRGCERNDPVGYILR